LFYGVFYTALGAFFIGMLAVFVGIMPQDKPTYYGMSSVMNSRVSPLNPGLGFRQHIDPEDQIIRYDPLSYKNPKIGSVKYSANIKNFLVSSNCIIICSIEFLFFSIFKNILNKTQNKLLTVQKIQASKLLNSTLIVSK
jgi:hypothetical protein